MITVRLYKNNSPKLTVDKNLTLVSSTTGNLLNGCSIVDPVLRISSASKPAADYLEVEEFGMFYYINDVSYVAGTNSFWDLTCECDPRKTCATAIKAQSAILDRSETLYNANLPDSELPLTAKTETKTYKIGDPLNKQHYMLLAANSYLGGTAT